MDFVIDSDVQAVAEFMQQRIAATRLVSVADGIAKVAPLLWGRYTPEDIQVLDLIVPKPCPSQPNATGCDLAQVGAGDGSDITCA